MNFSELLCAEQKLLVHFTSFLTMSGILFPVSYASLRGAALCSFVSSYQSALLYVAFTPTVYTGLQRALAFNDQCHISG